MGGTDGVRLVRDAGPAADRAASETSTNGSLVAADDVAGRAGTAAYVSIQTGDRSVDGADFACTNASV